MPSILERPAPPAGAGAAWRGPLSRTVDVLAPFVPAALASPAAMAEARRAADRLPAALTDELYLECRLAADDARVDLVLHLRGDEAAALGPALPPAPAWDRLRGLLAERADPRSALHASVCGTWVEMDVDGTDAAVESPGVFLDVRWMAERGASPGEIRAGAESWLGRLAGSPIPASALECLHRSLAALPPGAAAAYVGVFPGRGGIVRLCARGVGGGALPAYLARAGWEGDLPTVRALVDEIAGDAAIGMIHLDAGGGAARLGIELPLERRAQVGGGIGEGELARRLAALGLAAPEKAAALGAWPGWTEAVMPHQPWPSVLARRVNHLKLVMAPERPPQAKAYLWARHTHRRRTPEPQERR